MADAGTDQSPAGQNQELNFGDGEGLTSYGAAPQTSGKSGDGFSAAGAGALLTGAGALGGGILSYLGGQSSNAQQMSEFIQQLNFNQSEAYAGRAFSQYMRDTANQAEVRDLKLAGLNPMLAYMKPTSAAGPDVPMQAPNAPSMQNSLSAGVSSAAAAGGLVNDTIKNLTQNEYTKAQTLMTAAQAQRETANARQLNAQTDLTQRQSDLLAIKRDANVAEAGKAKAQAEMDTSMVKQQKYLDMVNQAIGGVTNAVSNLSPVGIMMNSITNRKAQAVQEGQALNRAGARGLPVK